ncbi:hypothetical protein HAX54_050389, partial [Datura stramonium]|nr:hypothetical protein [Datura stramonium]
RRRDRLGSFDVWNRVREEEMAGSIGEERRGSTGGSAAMVGYPVVVSPASIRRRESCRKMVGRRLWLSETKRRVTGEGGEAWVAAEGKNKVKKLGFGFLGDEGKCENK